MPHYVVSLMSEALNGVRKPLNGSKVLVAGIAYKKDVDDIRESPALDLLHLLRDRGAELSYTDPFVPKLAAKEWPNGIDLVNVDITKAASEEFDCVVVVTDHSQFDYEELQRVAKVVVDTRNAIKKPQAKVVRLGAARRAAAPELVPTH
jgi:UDP-N-acetyl-D-glucosamine dehydrogenase